MKERLRDLWRRVFGCRVCHGTGVVMSRECDCGGSPYTGHEPYCGTGPCPNKCDIAQTRSDALAVWCRTWRREEKGPGIWSIWATLTSGAALTLGILVLAGTMPVDHRWVAGPVSVVSGLLLGLAALWDQVRSR